MKKIVLDDIEYDLIKDYRGAFNLEELTERFTDYFHDFDYILGDYSYDKLRLKGFCNQKNKNLKEINDYNNVDKYLRDYCSYECRYFIIEKSNKNG